MNKKAQMLVAAVIGLFLIGGGAIAYTNKQNVKKDQDRMAMQKKTEAAALEKEDAMKKEEAMKKEAAMTPDQKAAMAKSGSYITLANYNTDTAKYADSKKVYFFHASWCPICQGIEKEINADTSKIPAGVTLIKTDFDTSTELRKKYGVTTQYTFVQVDNNGNQTAKWSASSLTDALAGIKS